MSDELEATAYVSWGIWVADCPRPDCLGAEHFGHAPITGQVGGLTTQGFRCNACELTCASRWPHNAEDITWILAKRPMRHNRNWYPHESMKDLLTENVAHGIEMPELEAGVTMHDERLVGVELTAVHRLMIGGGR